MAEAPAEDVTLTERDADAVLEELLPAQTQSYQLGMELKLEIHEIDAIHMKYLDPRDRLLHIILAFLRQAEPRPTWRVIVDALRSPVVNLTALAERVEAVHFPDSTATRPPPPATGPSSPDYDPPQTPPQAPPVDSDASPSSMAGVPAGDDKLTESDAAKILEELLEAQNSTRLLGLMLNVKPRDVEAIMNKYQDPKDRLYHIILAFLRQAEPRPTWRVIVDALRSPIVNLTALAERVEAAHFPDPTVTRPPPPATGPSSPYYDPPQTPPQAPPVDSATATSSEEVKEAIEELKKAFTALKDDTRECLEKQGTPVKRVADSLTSLSPDDDDCHKMFAESHVSDLFRAPDIPEQFGIMNSHWSYLDPSLLDHLVRYFNLEEVKGEMETYKSDLGQFRKNTPLTLFCRAQRKRHIDPPPKFRKVVAEFKWQKDATLEDVEQFRQEYAHHYGLHDCAMMLAKVRPGSFIVTWFVPESVVEKLKEKVPRAILKKYSVTKLEIAGTCVYQLRKLQEAVPSTSSGPVSAATATVPGATPSLSPPKPASEENYLFVKAPSEEFYCPVTFGLLLEPHLTSCCGKHLSQEAATRIQREGGACPLCNGRGWSTMFSKHFQRQVKSLCVFCRHEERGCGWQGELGTLDNHVQSCPMKDAPLMTKQPLYGRTEDTRSIHSSSEVMIPLKSPGVNLTALAERVEAAHFPDPTATLPPPPATASPDYFPSQTPTQTPPVDSGTVTSSEEVKRRIMELDEKFNTLKNNIKKYLEKKRVPVDQVADSLTSPLPDDDDRNKMFTESHVSDLFKADNISTQFGIMNPHWNYLDPSLLEHLVRKFDLEEVNGEMETYKSDVGQFRKKTLLKLFCRAQRRRRVRLSPDFQEVVAEFDWRNDVMLEDVEQFRQEYAPRYCLHEFAMMVAQVRPA